MLRTLGLLALDFQTVVVATLRLVGGVVSSLIMSQATTDAGLTSLSVLAILIYVMQGCVGYPLTAVMLEREGRRVLSLHRAGTWQAAAPPRMVGAMPASYNSYYFKFLRLGLVALLAWATAELVKPVFEISPFVLCLVFGVIATSASFLERQALRSAKAFGLTVLILMVFIFDGLKRATPEMLTKLAWP